MHEIALALSLLVAPADDAAVVRELTSIERQLATTWQAHDCDGWGALLADDWSVIHVQGQVITKAQALQMCRARDAPIGTLASDELAVRVFGDAAVVTGRTIATIGGAKPETISVRFTDVFVRRSGRWLVVASHATRLP